jgi:hypothetical protein
MHIKYLLKRAQTNRDKKKLLRFTVINHFPGKDGHDTDMEKDRYERFLRGPLTYSAASFQDFSANPETYYA